MLGFDAEERLIQRLGATTTRPRYRRAAEPEGDVDVNR